MDGDIYRYAHDSVVSNDTTSSERLENDVSSDY